MSQATAIEWTDVSWNPVHGCSIVSTECRNCYAQTLSLRYRQTLKPWTPANAAENVILKPHKLREPLSNTKDWRGLGEAAARAGKTDGKLVFVNSMSDLFHELVPFEFIDRVFETMVAAPQHTFQILTKRPERMLAYFEYAADYMGLTLADLQPWPNVWLGTSIGLRHFTGRADALRATPAAVRFISAEPLLGPLVDVAERGWNSGCGWPIELCNCGKGGRPEHERCGKCGCDLPGCHCDLRLDGIDWLITGGESGPGHRPMDLDWCRDLRDACERSGVAFFHKQHGGARPGGPRELDGRTWDEFPRSRA